MRRVGEVGKCPFRLPQLDEFDAEVIDLFEQLGRQWEWTGSMSFSRRVGIPIDRVMRVARLRGIYPEETFMERLGVCEQVIINYDIERIPKAEDD